MTRRVVAWSCVFGLFLAFATATPAGADLQGPEASWPLVGGGEPAPRSFEISMGSADDSTRNRGMVGGGGYYHATVHVAPRYEAPGDGKLYIALDDRRVTKDGVLNNAPGGLALLGWEFALMDISSVASRITGVRAYFDNGRAVTGTNAGSTSGGGIYEFPVPSGAKGLSRFEVDWEWRDNRRTLEFGASLAPRRYELLGLLAAVAGASLLKRKRWLAVRLVDEEKKPIPREKFKVRMPDGTDHEGQLDEYGFALVAYDKPIPHPGLEEYLDVVVQHAAEGGTACQVTFPNLDDDEVHEGGTATLASQRLEEG
jgi:hypothetical protein